LACCTGATEEYNGASWTSVNSTGLNTARVYFQEVAGTQTAALGAGGYTYPPATNSAATEEYDGSTWTSGNPLNTARKLI
jgi:hypothetical protein